MAERKGKTMKYKTREQVKGMKQLGVDIIEKGEEYCFSLPRCIGGDWDGISGDWDEQMYDTAIAEKRMEPSGIVFAPYIMMTDLKRMIDNSPLPQD